MKEEIKFLRQDTQEIYEKAQAERREQQRQIVLQNKSEEATVTKFSFFSFSAQSFSSKVVAMLSS